MRKKVFDYFRENEERHWWHVGKYTCARHLLHQLHAEGKRVLEIGASFGSFSRTVSDFADCVAFDYSEEALKAGGYPFAVCGDATALPFRDETYDVVVALDVLEHLRDDSLCVEETLRVLRPHGRALFFVPACPILWSDLDEINRHYRRYTKPMLRGLFAEMGGVEVTRLSYFNFFLFPPILMVRLVQRTMKRKWRRLSTESMKIPPAPVNALLKMLFLMEGRLVGRMSFPVGVSLILALRKVA